MRFVVMMIVVVALLVPVSVAAQEAYCTLGQYIYGNKNASFNDIPIPALLDSLITDADPLVIGMPGRGVTFLEGSEPTIVRGLTAVSKPAPLPKDLGDAVVDSSCELPPGFPALKNGKFRNSLLGEAIALSLNTRLDPDLAGLEVCPIMMTVAALPGLDGLYGTEDDSLCADCDSMTIRIPDEVLAALGDTSGVAVTVGDILDLANLTLAGQDSLFDVTPEQVRRAVKVINRGFKGCRYLVACTDAPVDTTFIEVTKVGRRSGTNQDAVSQADDLGTDELVLCSSSSASGVATIHYTVPEPCRVRLSVYSVAGREISVVVDGEVAQGQGSVLVPAGSGALPSGVYFIRLKATGVSTGRAYMLTSKMLVLR